MAAAFVQWKWFQAGAANTIASPSLTITGGNLVVVCIDVGNAVDQVVSTVTDTLGNTYHRLSATHKFNGSLFSGTAMEIWYAFNAIGGTTTVTATWSSAGGFSVIQVVEYSASPAWGSSDPIDTSNGATSSGTPSISLTLAQANELVVGFFALPTPTGWVWTNATDRAGNGGNAMADGTGVKSAGDFQPAASGGYSVTGTGGSATQFVGTTAAFKVPASTAKAPAVCIMQ